MSEPEADYDREYAEGLRIVEEHFKDGNASAVLMAQILLSVQRFLRKEGAAISLEAMTALDIIKIADRPSDPGSKRSSP